jgi:hypothetical protein
MMAEVRFDSGIQDAWSNVASFVPKLIRLDTYCVISVRLTTLPSKSR